MKLFLGFGLAIIVLMSWATLETQRALDEKHAEGLFITKLVETVIQTRRSSDLDRLNEYLDSGNPYAAYAVTDAYLDGRYGFLGSNALVTCIIRGAKSDSVLCAQRLAKLQREYDLCFDGRVERAECLEYRRDLSRFSRVRRVLEAPFWGMRGKVEGLASIDLGDRVFLTQMLWEVFLRRS